MRFCNLSEKPRYQFHVLLAVTALAIGGLAAAVIALPKDAGKQTAIPSMADLKETSNAFAAVTKRAAPAVVFIEVEKKTAPVATNFKGMPDWRDGERKTFDVTIGQLAAKAEVASAEAHDAKPLGLTVQPLTDELAEKQGHTDETGVVIANVESGSTAALAGLRPGWLIKEVNRKPVHDMGSFKAAVKEALDGKTVLLHVHAGNFSRYIALSIDG